MAESGHRRWADYKLDSELALAKQRAIDEQTYYELLVKEATRRGWAGYVTDKQFG